jgi:hypothetical protein
MNINDNFRKAFDALLEKYSELLIGENSPEAAEKVRYWALFSHIHKTMPALTSHWNAAHPEEKAAVRELFEEMRDKGRLHREKGMPATSNSDTEQPAD